MKKLLKRMLLVAMTVTTLSGGAQAGTSDATQAGTSELWKFDHLPGGYCEEIYWEDEYNCFYPGRLDLTLDFCMIEKFDEARKVCLERLESLVEQESSELENCASSNKDDNCKFDSTTSYIPAPVDSK